VVFEEEKEKVENILLLKPLSIKVFKANGGGVNRATRAAF